MIEILSPLAANHHDLQTKCAQALGRFLQRKEIGFHQVPERMNLWKDAQTLGQDLRSRFEKLVIVGMGGSSLGTRTIVDAFSLADIHFVDNVDPLVFSQLIDSLNFKTTGWLFVSKSGNTIEVLCILETIFQAYRAKGINFYERAAVITENKESPLQKWAVNNKVPIGEVPLDVGGRFSVLTAVSMVPASFGKLQIEGFRKGALLAMRDTNKIAQMMVQAISSFERGEKTTVLWIYASALKTFGFWFQQLWAESLGKAIDRVGKPAPQLSLPFAALGATDQHSVLQQFMDWGQDKWIIFLRAADIEKAGLVLEDSHFTETEILKGKTMGSLLRAEAEATEAALRSKQVSTTVLRLSEVNETSLGYLFMFFELLVAGIGEYYNINAFDQPGVELGKRLARERLKSET
jgi:glucose-6-phosphate isomerase